MVAKTCTARRWGDGGTDADRAAWEPRRTSTALAPPLPLYARTAQQNPGSTNSQEKDPAAQESRDSELTRGP